jgi:hypothetical protein
MEASELRRAVELAGLQWFEGQLGSMVNTGFSTMFIEDPALIPYVASVVVAKVWGTRKEYNFSVVDKYLDSFDTSDTDELFATDEQRIRAAVAALEATNTEQGEGND